MKKSALFLTSVSLFIMLAGTVSAQTVESSVNLVIGKSGAQIDGTSVTMSAPAQVIGGSTMVPLRFISEAFGCDVQWNSGSNTATVTLGNQIIESTVGQDYAIINGDKTEVQTPAQLINGSTYVPLRFISENLGAKVGYNTNTRAIAISIKLYINEEKSFGMILPTDWIADKEAIEGVTISSAGGLWQGQVSLLQKGEGIDPSAFNEFSKECFKQYETKTGMIRVDNAFSSGVIYIEDGLVQYSACKLLDDGIYFCTFAIPEESFDANVAGQCDIVINTLQ